MKLIIHRSSHEIGGTCIGLQSEQSRILLDFGLPLVDASRKPFESRKIKGKSKQQLIKEGILPNIKGLYRDEEPKFDAILLSHPHLDHYGLLSYVNPKIPVFLSEGCKALIDISYFFGQTKYDLKNAKIVDTWKSFQIKDLKIKPFLVDHSGFDALAFLIEGEKKIFYSGDFRGHGRKSKVFDNILKNPPKDIDYLILEGSMIGRNQGKYNNEVNLENKLVELFKKDKLYFVSCSSQNIDRLVSVFKACLRTDRTFVIDPYTAFILDKLKKTSPNIPQFNGGKNIKIFFVPNRYTNKLAENKILFKYKSAKITYPEMINNKDKIVVKDNFTTRRIFADKGDIKGSKLIYSMWEGYLPDTKVFWDKYKVPITQVHASGHAYIGELNRFVNAIKPKWIIPNHTFYPEEYKKLFGNNIKCLKDGEMFVFE